MYPIKIQAGKSQSNRVAARYSKPGAICIALEQRTSFSETTHDNLLSFKMKD